MSVPTWIFAVPRKLRHHAHLKKLRTAHSRPIQNPQSSPELSDSELCAPERTIPCLLQPLQTAEQMENIAPYPGTCPGQ